MRKVFSTVVKAAHAHGDWICGATLAEKAGLKKGHVWSAIEALQTRGDKVCGPNGWAIRGAPSEVRKGATTQQIKITHITTALDLPTARLRGLAALAENPNLEISELAQICGCAPASASSIRVEFRKHGAKGRPIKPRRPRGKNKRPDEDHDQMMEARKIRMLWPTPK